MSAIATAESVLARLIGNLPTGSWWLLRQTNHDELGIAAAFKRPSSEIDAVLAQATIYKEQKRGLSFKQGVWELYVNKLKEDNNDFDAGTYGRDVYVVNGKPKYKTPRMQIKANERCTVRATLPADLLAELNELASSYYQNIKPKEYEAKANEKAKQVAKKLQYPMLSKILHKETEINLENNHVEKLAKSLLTEVLHLYKLGKRPISVEDEHGKEILLEQIPRSKNTSTRTPTQRSLLQSQCICTKCVPLPQQCQLNILVYGLALLRISPAIATIASLTLTMTSAYMLPGEIHMMIA